MNRAEEYPWQADLPEALVVACSDGRLQRQLDAFLTSQLGLREYDRVYMPGGPGALASSGFEYLRADHYRRDCVFLIEAHGIRRVVFVFHGAGPGGPEEAACGDYLRKLPGRSAEEQRSQQDADADEVLRAAASWAPGLSLEAYRAEVMPGGEVRFTRLDEGRTRDG